MVTTVVSNGEDALVQAERDMPDLVLMDIKLEGEMDGIDTAIYLRSQLDIPVIYLTAHSDDALLERAKRSHPLGYLVKPYKERDLYSAIEMALFKDRLDRKLRESERKFRMLTEVAPFGITVMAADRTLRVPQCQVHGDFRLHN